MLHIISQTLTNKTTWQIRHNPQRLATATIIPLQPMTWQGGQRGGPRGSPFKAKRCQGKVEANHPFLAACMIIPIKTNRQDELETRFRHETARILAPDKIVGLRATAKIMRPLRINLAIRITRTNLTRTMTKIICPLRIRKAGLKCTMTRTTFNRCRKT